MRLTQLFTFWVDSTWDIVNESLKAVVQEVWRLCSQVVNGSVVVLFGALHRPIYNSHLEHKKRIKKLRTVTGIPRTTPFARLVEEDESLEEPREATQVGEEYDTNLTAQPPAFEIHHRGEDSASRNSERLLTVPQALNDLAHYHEQVTTGFLEDLLTNTIVLIDRCINHTKSYVRITIEKVTSARVTSLITAPFYLFNPVSITRKMIGFFKYVMEIRKTAHNLISHEQLDTRSVGQIITEAGYPYEEFMVTTEDGYILKMERIPNKTSKRVLYLQHGMFDCSFAWIATGSCALAFRAHDQGYDVFMGNFRGNGSMEHVRKNIPAKEYWDFSVNEHAFADIPAFTERINVLKREELLGETNNIQRDEVEQKQPYSLTMISHSMGGACALMYIVNSRLKNKPHRLSQAILLSPAGYHKHIPRVLKLIGPGLYCILKVLPFFYAFRFPSDSWRVLSAKVAHDILNSMATRDLLAYLVSRVLVGGDPANSPVKSVPLLTYHITGSPFKVCFHWYQLYLSGKFQAYDYGTAGNMREYGTPKPTDFLANYHVIDIPCHFSLGLHDNLIPPADVIKHYDVLHAVHPDLAFLKANENGHLDFTLGLDEPQLEYIMETLQLVHNDD